MWQSHPEWKFIYVAGFCVKKPVFSLRSPTSRTDGLGPRRVLDRLAETHGDLPLARTVKLNQNHPLPGPKNQRTFLASSLWTSR